MPLAHSARFSSSILIDIALAPSLSGQGSGQGQGQGPACGTALPPIVLESDHEVTRCWPQGTVEQAVEDGTAEDLEDRTGSFTCHVWNCDADGTCTSESELTHTLLLARAKGDCVIPDSGGVTGTLWTVTISGGVIQQSCTPCE